MDPETVSDVENNKSQDLPIVDNLGETELDLENNLSIIDEFNEKEFVVHDESSNLLSDFEFEDNSQISLAETPDDSASPDDNEFDFSHIVFQPLFEERHISLPFRAACHSGQIVILYTPLLVTALVLVVLAASASKSWQKIDAAATSERAVAAEKIRRVIESTNTRLDDHGRVTEISGTDPRHVLIAYCNKVDEKKRPTPIEIVQPNPPENGVRMGVFTDPRNGGGRYAIRIERRGGARNWVAGGNGEPVAVVQAPDVPPLAPRIPID